MKKILITIAGGTLVFLGLIFIIVPGPSLLLLIPGLYLLSLEYPPARAYLKKCQKLMARSARWLDGIIRKAKYSR